MEDQNFSEKPTPAQEPATPPTPPQQSSSKLTIILALLLTAIIAAFLAYYFTQKYYNKGTETVVVPSTDEQLQTGSTTASTTDNSNDAKADEAQPTATLILARLERTVGMNANPNSLQLHIVSHQSPDGNEVELANITAHNDSYNSIYSFGSKIYYITLSTQLGSYDLETGKTEIINIPGVDNSNEGYMKSFSISDFAFDQGKFVYMKGECAEASKCTVGIYDLVSKQNTIVLEDLMVVISPVMMDVTKIESFNAKTGIAVITDNGGDAGWGMSVYYNLNVNTGEIEKTDTAELTACSDEPDSMIGPCDPQQVASNKHYEELLAKKFTMCGDVKVRSDEYKKVIVEAGDEVEEIDDASFVACQ